MFDLNKIKIGFIGAGNMAQAIMSALIDSKIINSSQIYLSDINDKKLSRVCELFQANSQNSNEQLVDTCDIVFLAMKPQDMVDAIEPIAMSFRKEQVVFSIVTGVCIDKIKKFMPEVELIVRLMPNTPAKIRRGVIGYCFSKDSLLLENLTTKLLSSLGFLVPAAEGDNMQGLAVGCAAGTGFVFELMKYWQDWIEGYGFEEKVARKMTVETFLGAALLAEKESQFSINELQEQVTSKKGITSAGLDSMRENEIERQLRISFEKAVERDRQLANVGTLQTQKSRP